MSRAIIHMLLSTPLKVRRACTTSSVNSKAVPGAKMQAVKIAMRQFTRIKTSCIMAPRKAWSRHQTTFSDENGRIPACRQAGSAERFCRSKNIRYLFRFLIQANRLPVFFVFYLKSVIIKVEFL